MSVAGANANAESVAIVFAGATVYATQHESSISDGTGQIISNQTNDMEHIRERAS